MARILVVDDEIGIRELLQEILYEQGHTVELAENVAQARAARLNSRPDLVLLDIWMPDADGVSLLREWSSQGLLDMPVIMMSGHATLDTAVEATRIGAADFLEKPITLAKLLATVQQVLQRPVIRSIQPQAPVHQPVYTNNQVNPSVAPIQNTGGYGVNRPALNTPVTAPVANSVANTVITTEDAIRQGYLGSIPLDQPLRDARDEFERVYFEYHLQRENHSMTRVSEKTGLERTHLYRKLRQLGIDSSRKRNA
ncbi:XRE family transcriptional regulator [Pelistega indica]|uniref:XRE family transcriptional regulator n=1 Tax=Pelistega indica TaxID=1414851 RepID=V8FU96_9BURK|nr:MULTISPECIES: response regulator [Pelistega]ETD67864.1 XRE family transcriptional regulator [Pelistega indica]